MSVALVDPGGGADVQNDVVMNESGHICASSVIVDGLLCSIMKVISNTNNDEELAAAIVSEILGPEIKAAWLKLFSFIQDVLDESRKIPVIEIKRQTVRDMADDILCCLMKKECEFHYYSQKLLPYPRPFL